MIITLLWLIVNGVQYQGCIREAALAQVCVPANGSGKHDFSNVKPDTDYTFSYKADGVESDPVVFHTPKKKAPTAPSLIVLQ